MSVSHDPVVALEEFTRITNSLNTERDLHRLLSMVVTAARRITQAEAGLLYVLDSTKRHLHVEVFECDTLAVRPEAFPAVNLFLNDKPNTQRVEAYCAFSGKLVNLNDIYAYTGFDFAALYDFDRAQGYHTRSLLSVPLRSHDAVTIGVLQLINRQDGIQHQGVPFPSSLHELVSAFATQAAVALETAQLIEQNQRLIEALDHSNRELVEENERLRHKIQTRYDFSQIVGHGARMQQVFSLLKKVLHSDATVLLRGETGTGKELIARAIHHNSPRSSKELVIQNCAALPENLLESELFGYKKGAFSGAVTDKKGLIEQADGGTLFLDEIGDMPIGLQAKILRVLQEKEVRPLGALQSRRVNVRIVAATHCNLEEKVQAGGFREDLYYRLAVFPLELPPLRERRDDLPALVHYFVAHFSQHYGKKISSVSPKAFDVMIQYDYPGNIRELRNIIERAVLLCEDGGSLVPEHFPATMQGTASAGADAAPAHALQKGSLKEHLQAFERRILREALESHGWNQTQTAEALQIGRRTLIEKMQRYELKRPL
ncbi:MAG TPA: GAF domain-containing protein [Gammaproteobacteria bacterium]|nr:GAF domain-containing protein [Gammaproteobacteria bacterium]